jgi:hypothetical protein
MQFPCCRSRHSVVMGGGRTNIVRDSDEGNVVLAGVAICCHLCKTWILGSLTLILGLERDALDIRLLVNSNIGD